MLLVYTKTADSVFHAPLKIEKLWGILEKSKEVLECFLKFFE